jgi:hypothetical protein
MVSVGSKIEETDMMIAMTIICLFVIAALAAGLTLLDTWLQARSAFWSVYREQQLLEAGFIPQVEASETRLRQPLHRSARRTPARRVRTSGFGGAPRSSLGAMQNFG